MSTQQPPRFGDSEVVPRFEAAANPSATRAVIQATPSEIERDLFTEFSVGYRPQLPVYNWRDEYFNQFDFFWDIEAMLRCPDVLGPLSYVKSPIAYMEVKLRGQTSAQVDFMAEEWKKFKQLYLSKVQDSGYSYGWMGAECIYGIESHTGYRVLDRFKDFAPRDVQPMVLHNNVVGIKVRSILENDGIMSGSSKGLPAKGFWYAHRARYSQAYGLSQIEAAWKPWRRLTGRDGVEEITDIDMYRSGTGNIVIGAPLEDTKGKSGAPSTSPSGTTSALQRALEMGQNLKAGGAVAKPNTYDEAGNAKWTIDWLEGASNLPQLIEADRHLCKKISDGIGFPTELKEAATSGSGWSGREIPLIAFLMVQQTPAQDLFFAWYFQIGLPLLWWNFGPKAWVKAEVVPLLESYKKASADRDGQEKADKEQPVASKPPAESDDAPYPEGLTAGLSTRASDAFRIACKSAVALMACHEEPDKQERALANLAKTMPHLNAKELATIERALEPAAREEQAERMAKLTK